MFTAALLCAAPPASEHSVSSEGRISVIPNIDSTLASAALAAFFFLLFPQRGMVAGLREESCGARGDGRSTIQHNRIPQTSVPCKMTERVVGARAGLTCSYQLPQRMQRRLGSASPWWDDLGGMLREQRQDVSTTARKAV